MTTGQGSVSRIWMTESWANSKPELCFVTSWQPITEPTWPESNIPGLVQEPDWCLIGPVKQEQEGPKPEPILPGSRQSADRMKHEAHVLKGPAKTGQFAVWARNRQTGFTWNYRHKELQLDRKGWQQNGENVRMVSIIQPIELPPPLQLSSRCSTFYSTLCCYLDASHAPQRGGYCAFMVYFDK